MWLLFFLSNKVDIVIFYTYCLLLDWPPVYLILFNCFKKKKSFGVTNWKRQTQLESVIIKTSVINIGRLATPIQEIGSEIKELGFFFLMNQD